MKILIVDDKEEERYLAETLLKGSGYEVVSAVNGAEALEKLRAEGFDMIVSDILMPVMDGFQFCRECKGDEKLKDIPFVFYTAEYIENEDKDFALKLGVDKFIRKPIESDEFIKLIQGVFRDVEEGKKKPVAVDMKILVVEDNEDSRNLLVKQLHAYGHEIATAANGAEALEQALAQPPDVIVSDILMPKMDGYQLCHECKQNEQLKNVPFVFYTATYTKEEDEKFALSLGAAAFVVKPTEPDILVQMLSNVAEKAKSGALAPAKVAPLEPSLYLTEYTRRIVAKLEDKVAQLEIEITEHRRAEEALQIAEQNFRNSLDNSPLGIHIVTADGELLYANKAILDIYGYSSIEELKATPTKKRYTPESYAEHLERKEKRKLGKLAPSNYELSIVRRDGEIRHLAVSRKEVMWGGETQSQALYQDITERRKAEEEVRRGRDYLEKLTDSMWDAVFSIKMPERVIEWANDSFRLTGYESKKCIGKTTEFLYPDEREFFDFGNKLKRAIAGGKDVLHAEQLLRRKNGEVFPAEITTTFFKEKGEIVKVTSIVRDITERKRAEEALTESEEKYRTLFESMLNGFAYCKILVDENNQPIDFVHLEVNNAWERLIELKREDVIGKRITEVIQGIKESKTDLISIYGKVALTGQETKFDFYFEPLGKWFTVSAYSPQKGYFVAVFDDITERKRAEEEIKRAAEEWSTTFDSIADLISICDKDFRLIRVNKAFADTLNMKPEELVGKTCYQVIHGTNEPLLDCPHKKTIKTKKPATAEFFEPHLGMHLEVMTSPIFNENGEVVASVHLIRDITGRKKMEEQLIVTDRLASIGELASGIAHELNNPLTSVIGFSDLLSGKKDLPDDVKEDLKVINREAQRTARVVRNLLTFARKHPQEKQSVDINKIIQTVLVLRVYEQKVSNIQVNTHFAPDLPEIMADGFRLQQVFLNIIINAEHFMTEAHRRGTLTITTERVGDIIRASFDDDGPGIAKEDLGHLFDPFFTTKEVGKGTGLGLSISYGIITEHGGRIYAESELGKGATFVIELPIATTDNEGTVE